MPPIVQFIPDWLKQQLLSQQQQGLMPIAMDRPNPLLPPHLGPEMGGGRGGPSYGTSGSKVVAPKDYGQPKEGTVIPPSSPTVTQAIERLKAWLPINERNGPNIAMRKNIEILERGGPIAEAMAKHTLQTWGIPPTRGISAPTIDY